LKHLVRDWLPPAILSAIRRVRARGKQPDWEYCPEGWHTRSAAIRGWNVEDVVESQRRTWDDFVRLASGTGPLGINHTDIPPHPLNHGAHNTVMAFAYVLALAAHGKESVSLLDWGGGLGHYAVLGRSLLPPGVRLEYFCKEVPLLCAAGRRLLPEATFFDTEEACEGRTYDLVMASGSLHYAEDWRAALARLAGLAAPYFYLTRQPIVEAAPSFVVVQRAYGCGYNTEYLGWFLNRGEILNAASTAGLELVREVLIDEHPEVAGAPEQCHYRGFLFRRAAR
jgi:putative methyltransferase (TIGR04325 family)